MGKDKICYEKNVDDIFCINPKTLFKASKSKAKVLRINSINNIADLNPKYQKPRKVQKLLKGITLIQGEPKLALYDLGSEENLMSKTTFDEILKKDNERLKNQDMMGQKRTQEIFYVPQVTLLSADGQKIAVKTRVNLKKGFRYLPETEVFNFQASVLEKDPSHFDILISNDFLKNSGETNLMLSSEETTMTKNLRGTNGDKKYRSIPLLPKYAQPVRASKGNIIGPFEAKNIKINASKNAFFIQSELSNNLCQPKFEKNYVKVGKTNMLKPELNIVNNNFQEKIIRKGDLIGLELPEKFVFIKQVENKSVDNMTESERISGQSGEKIEDEKIESNKISNICSHKKTEEDFVSYVNYLLNQQRDNFASFGAKESQSAFRKINRTQKSVFVKVDQPRSCVSNPPGSCVQKPPRKCLSTIWNLQRKIHE